jgi:uncharacterized RDD family membrane protein YckC
MTGFERAHNDSSLVVQTPEGIEFMLYPAGFLIRASAWAIDCLIQGVILLAIIISIGIIASFTGVWLLFLIIFVLDWFYHAIFEIFFNGQSPGKRFMGIRVVRSDGSPVNPGASFLRNLLRFADTFLFLYLIAFICMLISPAFRRIGDWVGDTLVVYTANARIPARFTAFNNNRLPWLGEFPVVVPSRKLSYEEKQAVLSFALRYPRLGKARSDEIAGAWAAKICGDMPDSESRENETSAGACVMGIARGLGGTLDSFPGR